MYETRNIATDGHGRGRSSVCPSASLSVTLLRHAKPTKRIAVLFVMEISGGPWHAVLDGSLNTACVRGGGILRIVQ